MSAYWRRKFPRCTGRSNCSCENCEVAQMFNARNQASSIRSYAKKRKRFSQMSDISRGMRHFKKGRRSKFMSSFGPSASRRYEPPYRESYFAPLSHSAQYTLGSAGARGLYNAVTSKGAQKFYGSAAQAASDFVSSAGFSNAVGSALGAASNPLVPLGVAAAYGAYQHPEFISDAASSIGSALGQIYDWSRY